MLVALGLALLLAGWIAATRPFSAPDEAAHYLRALGIANGQLIGPRAPLPPNLTNPPAQLAWAQQDTRGVVVPAEMSPSPTGCIGGKPVTAGRSCVEPTNTGDYHPLPYLLPALALLTARGAGSGSWLSRIASALPCLAFLLLAVVLLAGGGWGSLTGLLLAVTPAALFVASVINPNGLEVASSLAVAAAALRVARSPARSPAWVWVALAVSAAVAVLSWQLGPVFVLVDLVVVAPALGRDGIGELWRARASYVRRTAVAIAAAVCAWLAYALASGVSHATFSPFPLVGSLRAGGHQLWEVLHESVGDFGTLTIPLPPAAYGIWWLLVLSLVGWALAIGSRRERLWTLCSVLISAGFPVVFYAWVGRHTGFGLQGRYMLPVLVLPPLVGGEVIRRHAATIPVRLRRWLPAGMLALAAAVQLFAWDLAARTAAGEPHSVWFLGNPAWRPPLGWWPWAASAALGTVALMSAAVLRARTV